MEIPVAKVKDLSSFHLQHATESSFSKPKLSLSHLNNIQLAYDYTLSFKQYHPGYDCVVLDTQALVDISKSVGNTFTAYPPVGNVLVRAVNDLARARGKNCKVATNLHSTFHVGSRNSDWGSKESKIVVDENGALLKSRNYTWSYLPTESKSTLRKANHPLGTMKCPIMKFAEHNSNHCFW